MEALKLLRDNIHDPQNWNDLLGPSPPRSTATRPANSPPDATAASPAAAYQIPAAPTYATTSARPLSSTRSASGASLTTDSRHTFASGAPARTR